jgi:hypothetical protein
MNPIVMFSGIISLILTSLSSTAWASHSNQIVRLMHNGPLLYAQIETGAYSQQIIAYKTSGDLAQGNPVSIDALLIGSCRTGDGDSVVLMTTVQLGREWHGTGYMSMPLSIKNHFPTVCHYRKDWQLQIAFFDPQGRWDSRYGENYEIRSSYIWGPDYRTIVFDTQKPEFPGSRSINEDAWKFIVDQMRN